MQMKDSIFPTLGPQAIEIRLMGKRIQAKIFKFNIIQFLTEQCRNYKKVISQKFLQGWLCWVWILQLTSALATFWVMQLYGVLHCSGYYSLLSSIFILFPLYGNSSSCDSVSRHNQMSPVGQNHSVENLCAGQKLSNIT